MNRNRAIIILILIALASGIYFFSSNKAGAPDFSKSFLQCSPREFTTKFAGASTYVITVFGIENETCHYTAKVVDQNGVTIPGGPGEIDCNVPLASVTPDVLNHLLGQDKTSDIAAAQNTLQADYCKKLTATVTYACNAGTIVVRYYKGETKPAPSPDQPPVPGGSVCLSLSDGRAMTLPQTVSADGGRYANADESFVFWDKGDSALVLENGQEKSYTGCTVFAQ